MQIKDVAVLEMPIAGSHDLSLAEVQGLLYRSFPKGFRDEITHTLEQKTAYGDVGNYVVQMVVPKEAKHINGEWYNSEKFDTVLRDTLARFQALVDQYQQFKDFTKISRTVQ